MSAINSSNIQWYPGHMTRAKRMMQENIRIVDLVIEILDARVPLSSRNPDIDRMAQGKQRLLILGKEDLADPEETKAYLRFFRENGLSATAMDLRSKNAKGNVLRAIQDVMKEKRERDLKRGIRNRAVRAMICGIPNVGKSTFINTLSGRASARTGNKPGVTTGKQWISFQGIDLLDTPGILWPKFDDQEVGMRLAVTGSIRDEILDETELAMYLSGFLLAFYPDLLSARYFDGEQTENMRKFRALVPTEFNSAEDSEMSYNRQRLLSGILTEIADVRRQLKAGGEPDPGKAAHILLDDFRSGRIGRITLDRSGASG